MTRLLLALAILFAGPVEAASQRDRSVRDAFQRENPCPNKQAQIRPGTAGGTRGACPGYQVDHRQSICSGGRDIVANLQWLSVEDHKAKTRFDVMFCNALKRARR